MATVALIPSAVVRAALADYGREVESRRRISAHDPVADTMEYVVRDLADRIRRAEESTEPLTPEVYADLPTVRVAPQTVRRWCRAGELPGAVLTEHGWMIPRDARRVKAARPARVGSPLALRRAS